MGKIAEKLITKRYKWARKTRDDELEEYIVPPSTYEELVQEYPLSCPMYLFGFRVQSKSFLREGDFLLLPKPLVDALDIIANWCSPDLAREIAAKVPEHYREEI